MLRKSKDYNKGIKIVDKLIEKATKERDTKGYRENLGYDSYPNLTDQLSKLELTYSEQCDIKDYFHKSCASI